jgi:DNA gyrase subunit A
VIAIKASVRNGAVVGMLQVVDDDQVMMITNRGKIIRTPMCDLRVIGRSTQGVRLFKLEENEQVVALDRLAEAVNGEDEDEADCEDPGKRWLTGKRLPGRKMMTMGEAPGEG